MFVDEKIPRGILGIILEESWKEFRPKCWKKFQIKIPRKNNEGIPGGISGAYSEVMSETIPGETTEIILEIEVEN